MSSTEWASNILPPRFNPDTYIDIEEFFELKMKSISAYEFEMRPAPHPRSPELISALATLRGAEVGINMAEALSSVRHIINSERWLVFYLLHLQLRDTHLARNNGSGVKLPTFIGKFDLALIMKLFIHKILKITIWEAIPLNIVIRLTPLKGLIIARVISRPAQSDWQGITTLIIEALPCSRSQVYE